MTTDTAVKAEQQEAAMAAAGVQTHEDVQQDYFGFEQHHTVTLPDGVSYVEFKVMTEGQRRKYLNEQNREISVSRSTGDARIKTAPGDERHSLLKTTIVGWNLKRNGEIVPFNPRNLEMFLDKADPSVVSIIEREVRKHHPWLLADMTLEDIDKQIEELQEMREIVEKRESGNGL